MEIDNNDNLVAGLLHKWDVFVVLEEISPFFHKNGSAFIMIYITIKHKNPIITFGHAVLQYRTGQDDPHG